jgi:hypothetical protein
MKKKGIPMGLARKSLVKMVLSSEEWLDLFNNYKAKLTP